MAVINLRIKDPNRQYFFIGDDVLNHTTWTPVETHDLSNEVRGNILTALDMDWIETDIPIEDARTLLTSEEDLLIVNTIADRDALTPAEGDRVLVKDIGDGTWSKFIFHGGVWVEYEKQHTVAIYEFKNLGDVNVLFDVTNDGKPVVYDNATGKLIFGNWPPTQILSAADIKVMYESNPDTNEFSDSEKAKLASIEPGATNNTTINDEAVILSFTYFSGTLEQYIDTVVNVNFTDIYNQLANKSNIGHNHDGVYAPVVHNHDADYAPIVHTHSDYALLNHSHTDYALLNHNHDGVYSPVGHNHDSRYDLRYAAINHNHDADYASITHNHDGSYEPIMPLPAADGDVLTRNLDGTWVFVPPSTITQYLINDSIISAGETWSSLKISTELSLKADAGHNHDLSYAPLGHDHNADYYLKTEVDNMIYNWMGAWDPATTYNRGDRVSLNGSSYISLVDNNIGNDPSTTPTVWDVLALKGDTGPQGPQGLQGDPGTPGVGVPAGGNTGEILVKRSAADFDTEWQPSGLLSKEYLIILGEGNQLVDRITNAVSIPPDLIVQDGLTAGHPNFGSGDDTLVITHNQGKLSVNIEAWEMNEAGPLIAQGATRIDLTTQGQIKNATDLNACAIINLQALTNPARKLYIYVKLV